MAKDPFTLSCAARALLVRVCEAEGDGLELGGLGDVDTAAAGELFDAELVETRADVVVALAWVRVWIEDAEPRPARELLLSELPELTADPRPGPAERVQAIEEEAKRPRGDHGQRTPQGVVLLGLRGIWPLEDWTAHTEARDQERFPGPCPACQSRKLPGNWACLWCGGRRPKRAPQAVLLALPEARQREWRGGGEGLKGGVGA